MRLAPGQRAKLHQREHLADAGGDRSLGQAFLLQPEGDVLLHAHMRKQRVRLEHHVDRALVRRQRVDGLTIQDDAPLGRPLEAGKAAQQRGFAAARTTEQREDLALANLQADVVDRDEAVELLADRVDAQVAAVASGEVGLRGGLGGCHSTSRLRNACATTANADHDGKTGTRPRMSCRVNDCLGWSQRASCAGSLQPSPRLFCRAT